MNASLYRLSLSPPVSARVFVEKLQKKFRGRGFNTIGYTLHGPTIRFSQVPYAPFLDDFTTSFMWEIVFTPLPHPRSLAVLLSTIRVAFRGTSFDELLIYVDRDGDLIARRSD